MPDKKNEVRNTCRISVGNPRFRCWNGFFASANKENTGNGIIMFCEPQSRILVVDCTAESEVVWRTVQRCSSRRRRSVALYVRYLSSSKRSRRRRGLLRHCRKIPEMVSCSVSKYRVIILYVNTRTYKCRRIKHYESRNMKVRSDFFCFLT